MSVFKVMGTLTGVRPPKTTEALVITSPTKGNIKVNSAACTKLKVAAEDYLTICPVETDNGLELYLTKGVKPSEDGKTKQVGAILSGKSGGTLMFSSENAYQELGGNKENNLIYSVADAVGEADGKLVEVTPDYKGSLYYKLTFKTKEAKAARTKKESANTQA